MIRFKICGITREEDAILAEQADAWAVGFIFAEKTPRYISPENACRITKKLSPDIEKIGVFLNSSIEEIAKINCLTKIQLHGEESPEFCRQAAETTGKEVIKAFRIKSELDLARINDYKDAVSSILLDSYSENTHGGTGKTFNWEVAVKAKEYDLPVILAGGLNPDNIIKAYKTVKPYALDLSSGLEASKGIKDPDKIKKLSENIKKER